jgi:hypothetical protein
MDEIWVVNAAVNETTGEVYEEEEISVLPEEIGG